MRIIILAVCVLLVKSAYSKSKQYENDQVWSVTPSTEEELQFIANLINTPQYKLDSWKDPRTINREINFRVPFSEIPAVNQILQKRKLAYRVMIPDVQHLIDSQTASSGNRRAAVKATNIEDFDYSNYHPAEEVYEWIDFVARDYSFARKFEVGITTQGRTIYALRFANGVGTAPKKAIYVDALIHCREWITTATTMWTFKEMLTKPEYSTMWDDYDWYFIPMINIDGYVHTWTEDRLWRKTLSQTATRSCTGVDGNRNWNVSWGGATNAANMGAMLTDSYWEAMLLCLVSVVASGEGSSERPCNFDYHGPFPYSEPEVRHLSYFIMENKDQIQVLLSVHSYSQLLLYPYNYDSDIHADNDVQLHNISKAVCEAMYKVHGKTYVYGRGAETLYVASGFTMDWAHQVANIPISYTYELRDTGEFGFLLPADQIIPNGQEFLAGLVVLVQEAQNPVASGYGPNEV